MKGYLFFEIEQLLVNEEEFVFNREDDSILLDIIRIALFKVL